MAQEAWERGTGRPGCVWSPHKGVLTILKNWDRSSDCDIENESKEIEASFKSKKKDCF